MGQGRGTSNNSTKQDVVHHAQSSTSRRKSQTRIRTTHACDRCRVLRVKCSGHESCTRCEKDGTECLYGETAKKQHKRKLQETAEEYRTLLADNKKLQDYVSELQDLCRAQTVICADIETIMAKRHKQDNELLGEKEQATPEDAPKIKSARSSSPQDAAPPHTSTTTPGNAYQASVDACESTDATSPQTKSSGTASAASPQSANRPCPQRSISFLWSLTLEGDHRNTQFSNCSEWQILPRTQYDPDPLCRVATDFIFEVERAVHQGQVLSEIIGDDRVEVQLYFRDRVASDSLSVSNWASELQKTFHGEYSCALQLGEIFMLTRLMRWLLSPSPETYAGIPTMMRPTLPQLVQGHGIIADMMPIAAFREAMINSKRDIIQATIKAGITVNWQGTLDEALYVNYSTGNVYLSSDFMTHVSDPRNWILGKAILDDFPDVLGRVILAEEYHVASADQVKMNRQLTELQEYFRQMWRDAGTHDV